MHPLQHPSPATRRCVTTAPSMLTAEEAAALHPAPPVTESKIRRLRLLAAEHEPEDPRERREQLPHSGRPVRDARRATRTRSCAPASPATRRRPCDVLRSLADDESETVRGWVAVNFFVPADVMETPRRRPQRDGARAGRLEGVAGRRVDGLTVDGLRVDGAELTVDPRGRSVICEHIIKGDESCSEAHYPTSSFPN